MHMTSVLNDGAGRRVNVQSPIRCLTALPNPGGIHVLPLLVSRAALLTKAPNHLCHQGCQPPVARTPQIKVQLNTLRRRLFTHIVQSLDTDARAPAPNPSPASTSAGCNPTSRWNRVRMKFLSMFTTSCSTLPSQPQGAGPSLVPEARNRTREELQALLLDLHDDLMGQVGLEATPRYGRGKPLIVGGRKAV